MSRNYSILVEIISTKFQKINKKDNLESIKTYLENKCVRYYISSENNTTRIRWNKSLELPFRYAMLYNESKEKYINPDWLNLPLNKVKFIVKGLIDSDGSVLQI